MSRVFTAALFVAGLGACTYIYGLDDFEGEGAPADAGASDGSSTSDGSGSEDGGSTIDAADGTRPFAFECDAGIIAHWPMDEGTGVAVLDRCAARLDGILDPRAGTATWGKRGDSGCVEVSGDGRVKIAAHPALELTGPFTIAGFVRSNGWPTGYASVYWNFDGTAAKGVEITLSYGGTVYAQLGFGNTNAKAPFPPLVDHVWTHLAVVFEPDVRIETFTNGKSVGKVSPPSGRSVTNSYEVGLGTVDKEWTGAIDDVIVFSRALSSDEIAALAAR